MPLDFPARHLSSGGVETQPQGPWDLNLPFRLLLRRQPMLSLTIQITAWVILFLLLLLLLFSHQP